MGIAGHSSRWFKDTAQVRIERREKPAFAKINLWALGVDAT
jgi:hypothetical protein